MQRDYIKNLTKIVFKFGTNSMLFLKDNPQILKSVAQQIAKLKGKGFDITIVSSGSIGFAIREMGLGSKPNSLPKKQALAAFGQGLLIKMWEKAFSPFNLKVAQVLLTYDVMEDRSRFLNAQNCFNSLKKYNILPIVNENDTIRCDEIEFGDNDNLSVFTALLTEAQLLVFFTDTDGIYDSNPHTNSFAKKISTIKTINEQTFSFVQEKYNSYSTGGMSSKLASAKLAAETGIAVLITKTSQNKIVDIFSGADVGTFILASKDRIKDRKKWLQINKKIKGQIVVDDGAKKAIIKGCKSLLASGVVSAKNEFSRGSIVGIADTVGKIFARGVSCFANHELSKIIKEKSLKNSKVVVDRNNMILL